MHGIKRIKSNHKGSIKYNIIKREDYRYRNDGGIESESIDFELLFYT